MNNYFSHDSNARNSDKLLPVRMKYGAEGYGIYFMILERLREEKNYMSVKDYNMLAFDLRVDAGKLKSIVEDFGLFAFTDDGECFYSEGFNKRMEIKDEKSKKRSEAGKKGAAKRWQSDSNAITKPSLSDSKESKVKETKVNKSKVNESSSNALEGDQSLNSFLSFQKLWAFPNEFQRQDLLGFIDQASDDLVDAAIKIAGTKDVKKGAAINFIDSCLREWADANVITLEQAREYQRKRNGQSQQHRASGFKSNVKPSEQIPDYQSLAKPTEVDPEKEARLKKMLADLEAADES